ncbi:hypothetical protein [Brevibacterium aurantiacum]|nr:hypothetical protein [Brevibacterium aurantiacum]
MGQQTRDAQRARGRNAASLFIGEIEGRELELRALLLEVGEQRVGFGRD